MNTMICFPVYIGFDHTAEQWTIQVDADHTIRVDAEFYDLEITKDGYLEIVRK